MFVSVYDYLHPSNISSFIQQAKNLGPYDAIGVSSRAGRRFSELSAFLSWVESDGRYLRVDSIKIDPNQRDPGHLKAQLKLLSLAEATPAHQTPSQSKASHNHQKRLSKAR